MLRGKDDNPTYHNFEARGETINLEKHTYRQRLCYVSFTQHKVYPKTVSGDNK